MTMPAVVGSLIWFWLAAAVLILSSDPASAQDGIKRDGIKAEHGVLDLRSWNPGKDGVVELDGEWLVSWGRLAGEESWQRLPLPDGKVWVPVTLPLIWNGVVRPDGGRMDGQGAATFRLQLLLPPGTPPLTLQIPAAYSATRLWVDGQVVVAAGKPALDAATEEPVSATRFTTLPGGRRVMELALEISNHFHVEGGIGRTLHLDGNGELSRVWQRQLMTNAGALMSLALMALFIAAFVRRGVSAAAVYLVLLLFACTMRLVCTSGLLRLFFPEVSEAWAYRLEYLPIYMFYPIYFHLLRSLFPGCLHRWVGQVMLGVSVAGVLMVLFTQPAFFTRFRDVASLLLVLSALYFAWCLGAAAWRRHFGALLLGAGALAFLASVVHDALMYAHLFQSIDLVPYGALLFMFSHALVLGRRVVKALDNVRDLSQELAALNEGLERQIAERTRALSDKSTMLERFLANLSHEVRTPLNALLGMVRVIRREGATERLDERLRVADDAGRHLVTMLDSVLELARLDAGRTELEPEPTDVAGLVEDAVALMQPSAEEKGLRLTLEVAGIGATRFWIDPVRFRQIVLNLLSNAVKFTEQGGVMVSLSARPAGASAMFGGMTLVLTVADTGPGVPMAAKAIIFEPFQRGVGGWRDGTGLGLAIVKRLAGLMGGAVDLHNRPGGGSVFSVTVQTRPVPVPERERTAPLPEPGLLDILVVEDAPENQAIMREYLAPGRHRVVCVETGEDALARLFEAPVDVVLLDMRLPGMDGVEVARRIRALSDPDRALTPIIAVTANSSPEDCAQYLDAGVDEVVSKPVDPDVLHDALARHAPTDALQPAAFAPASLSPSDRARLRGHFAQACREARTALADRSASPERLAELAHRLKGSGATYGFPELSEEARVLERAALTLVQAGPVCGPGENEAFSDAILVLERRVADVLRAIETGEGGGELP
ncbi:response regulator [Azospirillum canadense]|uniref:response regulator n=1 Tax=Azospirillum canadense TaxID=403962 RepID=UPI0022265388|nr:response regulator [Azospirillum canadense]MCW2242994.1 signal transduction histidine kinase/CheY-like chemotaxis protein/HPt (histidine-containing phosphotransfer) domain-containing protein [Azospirillum canadense]